MGLTWKYEVRESVVLVKQRSSDGRSKREEVVENEWERMKIPRNRKWGSKVSIGCSCRTEQAESIMNSNMFIKQNAFDSL